MRKILVSLAMLLPSLISCGGGGGGGPAAEVVPVPTVSVSVLTSCIDHPSLDCLAGKVSMGKENGADCGVKFSTDGFNIVSLLNPHISYQPANVNAQDMNYVFDSYLKNTGDLRFTVTALNAGAPYFSLGFSGNTKTGGGTALLNITLSPDVPGAPDVTLQCTVNI